ncbi:hypothetical protein ACIQU6_27985 [Streptomyces sp. NPDC090442]|uniref:hypothetical protein n=1 Tax=Streptomyces sp. NPDC090442 TaxID=3365962 RepID=UPI00380637FB
MRTLTLPDGSEVLFPDRPASADFGPLPYKLTVDGAAAVRACQVQSGDLVVAQFPDVAGIRATDHVPEPFVANPRAVSDCPCDGCVECEELDAWTLADHARIADADWRFICLAPPEGDEPCLIVTSNQPIAVIRDGVVARAKAAAADSPVRTFRVMWSIDFEARTPEEAARRAYEQLQAYGADAWPSVLEVEVDGVRTVVDLNSEGEEGV